MCHKRHRHRPSGLLTSCRALYSTWQHDLLAEPCSLPERGMSSVQVQSSSAAVCGDAEELLEAVELRVELLRRGRRDNQRSKSAPHRACRRRERAHDSASATEATPRGDADAASPSWVSRTSREEVHRTAMWPQPAVAALRVSGMLLVLAAVAAAAASGGGLSSSVVQACSSDLEGDSSNEACFGWCSAINSEEHCKWCKVSAPP